LTKFRRNKSFLLFRFGEISAKQISICRFVSPFRFGEIFVSGEPYLK
jgi:hypothetical protein